MLTGENGVLNKATTSKQKTEEAEVKESVELMGQDYAIEKHMGQMESIKEYFQNKASKGEISRIVDNKDDTYTIEKDGYQVIIDRDGKTQSINKKEIAEVTEVWYKVEGSTLYLSNSDLGGYTKHDESLFEPEWAGSDFDISPITKVIFQNKLVPTDTTYWFYGFENLTEIENINYLDTSNVTSMAYMFYKCKQLVMIDVTGFDTSNVTSMWGMFSLCSNLVEVDVSGFNTSKVNNMQQMFQRCGNLKELNLKSFNTSNVIYMMGMFVRCISLEELDISTFDSNNIKSSDQIFTEITCPVYIGNKWTLTEDETGYDGDFIKI